MRRIVKIGKPVHFRPGRSNLTACGLVGATYAAYDYRDVECFNCIKSKAYKKVKNL